MNPLAWLRRRIEEAGALREEDTVRDGFLSYASESHAIGYGLAIGAAIALHLLGVPFVLELVVLALGGVGATRRFKDQRVWKEIRDEPQYFVPSIVVGFVLVALVARFVLGVAVTGMV